MAVSASHVTVSSPLLDGNVLCNDCAVAGAWAQAGDRDRAFAHLEHMISTRSCQAVFIAVEPVFDPLRGDSRFDDLARRMGLSVPALTR